MQDARLVYDLSTHYEEIRCVQYVSAQAVPENSEEKRCEEDLHRER